MPRIPQYIGKPGPTSPTPTADAFGLPQARGTAALAGGIGELENAIEGGLLLHERTKRVKENSNARVASAKAKQAAEEAIAEATGAVTPEGDKSITERGQSSETLEQAFDRSFDGRIEDIVAPITGENRRLLDEEISLQKQAAYLKLRGIQRSRDIDEAKAGLEEEESIYLSAAEAPDANVDILIARYRRSVDALREDNAISAVQRVQLIEKFSNEARSRNEKANFVGAALGAADALMDLFDNEEDRLKAIRRRGAITDPRMREAVEAEVKSRSAEERRFGKLEYDDRVDLAMESLENEGTSLLDVDVDSFNAHERRAMKSFVARRDAGTDPSSPDNKRWLELLMMAEHDPDKFAWGNEFTAMDRLVLGKDRYKEIRQLQSDIQKKREALAKPTVLGLNFVMDDLDEYYGSGTAEYATALATVEDIIKRENLSPERGGVKLTPREEHDLAKRAMVKVDNSGFMIERENWFGLPALVYRVSDGRPLLDMDREEVLDFLESDVQDMPKPLIEGIVKDLERGGITPEWAARQGKDWSRIVRMGVEEFLYEMGKIELEDMTKSKAKPNAAQ